MLTEIRDSAFWPSIYHNLVHVIEVLLIGLKCQSVHINIKYELINNNGNSIYKTILRSD